MIVQSIKYNSEGKDEKNHQIKKGVQFIKDFYSALGYNVEVVESILRELGGKTFIEYTPILKNGYEPRNLTIGEKYDLNLDKWGEYCFLGFRGRGKGALIPLAARKCSTPPELLRETYSGMFLIKEEKLAMQILEMVDILHQKNVVLYTSSVGMHDILLFLEFLLLKGGFPLDAPSLSYTSCGTPTYQFYVQLPPHYPTLHKAKNAIRLIKQGFLPYEIFSGFWIPFPPNAPMDEIRQRIRWFTTIAVISYQTLCKKYSYLAPLIYDVFVDSLYQINAPLATLTQYNEYKKILQHNFKKYPLDNWVSIPYHSVKDLLVKRFAYEKFTEIVFAPDNERIMIYTEKAFIPLTKEEEEEEQKELEYLLKKQKPLPSPSYSSSSYSSSSYSSILKNGKREREGKREIRCLENCGLERSLCCIDTDEFRLEPLDLENEVLELSMEQEEKLARMEWGVRGYFSLGGVLKGLFQEPPLPSPLPNESKGKKIIDKTVEGNILLYLIQTEDGREIPILNREMEMKMEGRRGNNIIEGETIEMWNQGDLLTPWGRAMLEYGMESVSLKPELCEGGQCLLSSPY